MEYAGIGRRVAAGLVDSQLMWPLVMAVYWLSSPLFISHDYRLESVRMMVAGLLVGLLFAVVCLKRFGGTPGMLMLGMRVSGLDGGQLRWREIMLRHLLPFVLGLLAAITFSLAIFRLSQLEYLQADSYDMFLKVYFESVSFRWAFLLMQMLDVASFIYMFLNSRRQSLYDWMAGTVVIMRPADAVLTPQLMESPGLTGKLWRWLDACTFAGLMGRYLSLLPLVLFISFAAFFFPVMPVCLLLDIEFSNLGPIATAVWGFIFDIFILTPAFVVLMLVKLVRRIYLRT